MEKIKFIGGARIGMANSTWPFAKLTVSKDRLDLNASIFGNLAFTREDIESIGYFSGFMSSGLRINHKVSGYKKKVIFWTFSNPQDIIHKIKVIGFFDTTAITQDQNIKQQVIEKQKRRGFPMRIAYIIALILIWNLSFFLDFNRDNQTTEGFQSPFGVGALFALTFLLVTSILTLTSKTYRLIALKKDRGAEDVRGFMYFIIFITGLILLNFLLINLLG